MDTYFGLTSTLSFQLMSRVVNNNCYQDQHPLYAQKLDNSLLVLVMISIVGVGKCYREKKGRRHKGQTSLTQKH